jgi:hypothetical protein
MSTVVDDPAALITQLASLHDVRIECVCYESDRNRLLIGVADLNWGLDGEPGYVERPCRLVFSELNAFAIMAGQDRFHTSLLSVGSVIGHASAISKNGTSRMDFVMRTSESWFVEFGRLEIEEPAR